MQSLICCIDIIKHKIKYSIRSWFLEHWCKMMISPGAFFIFSKFWFFGLLGWSKVKKWPRMTKNSIHHALCLNNHTSYDIHTYKRIMQPILLIFFQILIFSVNGGVKGQKMAQMTKTFVCDASYLMNQISYIVIYGKLV